MLSASSSWSYSLFTSKSIIVIFSLLNLFSIWNLFVDTVFWDLSCCFEESWWIYYLSESYCEKGYRLPTASGLTAAAAPLILCFIFRMFTFLIHSKVSYRVSSMFKSDHFSMCSEWSIQQWIAILPLGGLHIYR